MMLSFHPGHRTTILIAGALAGGAALGCSRDGERSPTLETAASTQPVAAATVSAPTPDSAAAVDTPATPKPAVKKKAAPRRDTTVAAKPAAETPASPAAPATGQDQRLKYDTATNTVNFELIGGPRGFEFNGYASGGATLTLPPKATVVMNFINKDGTPHSAEVISGDGAIPNAAGNPAIPRAYTNKALEGLPQEGSDVMQFTVPETGKYRIFCGVPGHGLSGMWIWMVVDPAAKAPSFGPTKG